MVIFVLLGFYLKLKYAKSALRKAACRLFKIAQAVPATLNPLLCILFELKDNARFNQFKQIALIIFAVCLARV